MFSMQIGTDVIEIDASRIAVYRAWLFTLIAVSGLIAGIAVITHMGNSIPRGIRTSFMEPKRF